MSEKKALLVCNAYPSENNIYKNGFIHRRVKLYLKNNLDIVVFCVNNKFTNLIYDNYDGVTVIRGNKTDYESFLKENDFHSYLIHFISKDKYDPIIETKVNPKIIIWIHGSEVEAWHRRWFDFLTSREALKRTLYYTIKYYPERIEFLNNLYSQETYDVTFIYVSRWFKENVADVDAKTSPKKYEIIPNVVDGELFNYLEKDKNKRKKILSIRPFANMKYSNDLTVEAILELSTRDYFYDLEFSIYGDGKYFDSVLEPIRKFENVNIHKGFLKQDEISALHKEYGVFICPTRWDSQGVSMCEAMSSGLVPISTNITAIPEFVKHNKTGLLALPESGKSLARQVEKLYFDENLFLNISREAAKGIREIAGQDKVISKELDVILGEQFD